MSVRKFWIAGNPAATVEYTAEVNQDALQPKGVVRKDSDQSIVDPEQLGLSMLRALRVASLCNVATYVVHKILYKVPTDVRTM